MKLKTTYLAVLAALTIAGPASAAVLLLQDNFNTPALGNGNFNNDIATDQSGTAATQTYTTYISGGWDGAYQRGNGGAWLMHAGSDGGSPNGFGGTDKRGSLNYDIAAAANAQAAGNRALEISFNMSVTGSINDTSEWTSFTIGNQNPSVNAGTVGFSSLFRDSGGTQQFSNGADLSGSFTTPSFTDGQLITFVISDFDGSGSAFNSDGETDVVKMYVNGSLAQTFTGLNLDATDQYISFQAASTIAHIDNLSISAIPEPATALLAGLGALCLLSRRRK